MRMSPLLSCITPALVASFPGLTSKIVIGVLLFTFKDHKNFLLNFLLTLRNRCVRKYRWFYDHVSWIYDFSAVARILWLGGFPHNKYDLNIGAPLSPLMSILLCSSPPFPMLA